MTRLPKTALKVRSVVTQGQRSDVLTDTVETGALSAELLCVISHWMCMHVRVCVCVFKHSCRVKQTQLGFVVVLTVRWGLIPFFVWRRWHHYFCMSQWLLMCLHVYTWTVLSACDVFSCIPMRDGFKLLLLWGDSIDHIPSNEAKIVLISPNGEQNATPSFYLSFEINLKQVSESY